MPRTTSQMLASVALLALASGTSTGCIHAVLHNHLVDSAGGLSVGAPAFGYLLHPVRVQNRGTGYELFRTPAEGGQVYGTRRLVDAVVQASLYVRRRAPGGAPLRVGDLSARLGGHIQRHQSHRAGRDVDLIYYALDASGRSVPAPAFVRYDAAGASLDPSYPLRLDVPRNWYLVEALARDTDAGVIRIFCADRVRALLLGWARAHGRDPALIARAETLMHQPGDSAPHDDHFHVRIACSIPERALGCRDGAPLWWWLEKNWAKGDSAPADDATLLALLEDAPEPPAVAPQDLAMTPAAPPADEAPAPMACLPTLAQMRMPPAFVSAASWDGEAPEEPYGVCRP